MFFNSIEFAIFFPVVFLLYWLVFKNNVRLRNLFIILVSYFFYGMWDWRFLSLIVISSLADFVIGAKLQNEENDARRKLLLVSSIVLNIGILGFFKYFNFFADSFINVFTLFGAEFTYNRLNIILPVGISFYTFQTLSYTLDIYKGKLNATKDVLSFFAFVSFFPQLVAGPIERAKDLLPQFFTAKKVNYEDIRSGLVTIAIGLFKKIVIADRLAIFVDSAFDDIPGASGAPILIASIFFAFQLYLDFSAYSDIAIGVARTLGFKLSTNFRRPYLSISFSGFWSRWHISLSSWFRDYVYIPLGGNRGTKMKTILNIMIVFVLSGLWHGASWNFVIWGLMNGLFLILLDEYLLKIIHIKIVKSFIVILGWVLSLIFFRAETFSDSILAYSELGFSNFEKLYEFGLNGIEFKLAIWLLVGTILMELVSEKLAKNELNISDWLMLRPIIVRYSFYIVIIGSVLFFGSYGVGLNDQSFIYFQF